MTCGKSVTTYTLKKGKSGTLPTDERKKMRKTQKRLSGRDRRFFTFVQKITRSYLSFLPKIEKCTYRFGCALRSMTNESACDIVELRL